MSGYFLTQETTNTLLPGIQRSWGVVAGEAGATSADIDRDGQMDLIISVTPDLYVFRNSGGFEFEPIYYTRQTDSGRPLIEDGNGDGRLEMVLARDDQIVILEQSTFIENSAAPTGFEGDGFG